MRNKHGLQEMKGSAHQSQERRKEGVQGALRRAEDFGLGGPRAEGHELGCDLGRRSQEAWRVIWFTLGVGVGVGVCGLDTFQNSSFMLAVTREA